MINIFSKPKFFELSSNKDKTKVTFLIEPLNRGLAASIGNSLRRTLLAFTPGPAIFGVDIKGVNHEFSAIEKIKENVLRIILNLRKIIFKVDDQFFTGNEYFKLSLKSNENEVLYAKDIALAKGIKILNKDIIICHQEKGADLEMTIYGRVSVGYDNWEENKFICKEISNTIISVDSDYSPIIKSYFDYNVTKIGQTKNLEALKLYVETNGSITAKDAVITSAKILMDHLNLFKNFDFATKNEDIFNRVEVKRDKNLDLKITELGLNHRSCKCLKNNDIVYVKDLIKLSEEHLLKFKNFGHKSLYDIKTKLSFLKLKLKDNKF